MRRIRRAVVATVSVVAAATVVVMLVGGLGVRPRYREPWSPAYHEQFDDPRMQLVAVALLAPSGHNEQPWRIELDPEDPARFDLFVDTQRLAPVVDPLARQTLISQGTFLEYLRIAGDELGHPATVELFPEGTFDEPHLTASMATTPVARVTLGTAAAVRAVRTYSQMFRSDTNRAVFQDSPVTSDQEAALVDAVDTTPRPGGAPVPALDVRRSSDDIRALSDLARQGMDIESRYADAYAETAAITRSNERAKNAARYGFSVEGQGTSGALMYLMQGALTVAPGLNDEAASGRMMRQSTDAALAHTPAFALLTTPGNTRVDQVQAGVAFARLSLEARAQGLVVQPLSQVLEEYPLMARPYAQVHADFAPDGQTIQMLVRVGASTREYPPSMRLDARDLVG